MGIFRRNEPEPIYFFTEIELLANDFKGETFINLLFICLAFRHLEDKSSTFLILLIFPFWLDSFSEDLNRVNAFLCSVDSVARLKDLYAFCL